MTWQDVLGLAPGVTDPVEVRRAYARRLKECRPDVDPAGFARIREAKDALLGARGAAPEAFEAADASTDLPAPAPSSPDRARSDAAPPDLDAQIAEACEHGSIAEHVELARRLVASPAALASVRDMGRVVELAERVALPQPDVAAALVSAWWECASGRDRERISLAEVDRRRIIGGLVSGLSRPVRRVVFALATGTPSTNPHLAADVPVLEEELRRRGHAGPLVDWILGAVPEDPLAVRLKERIETALRRAAAREAQAARALASKESKSTWMVSSLIGVCVALGWLGRSCSRSDPSTWEPPKTPAFDLDRWKSDLDQRVRESVRPNPSGDSKQTYDDLMRLLRTLRRPRAEADGSTLTPPDPAPEVAPTPGAPR